MNGSILIKIDYLTKMSKGGMRVFFGIMIEFLPVEIVRYTYLGTQVRFGKL